MERDRNSDINGKPFDQTTLRTVWKQGTVIRGYDPRVWCCDICGKPIKFSEYGNTNSDFGWEVDHKCPIAKGGTDDLDNLQPLQWDMNRKKGDTYPWKCS